MHTTHMHTQWRTHTHIHISGQWDWRKGLSKEKIFQGWFERTDRGPWWINAWGFSNCRTGGYFALKTHFFWVFVTPEIPWCNAVYSGLSHHQPKFKSSWNLISLLLFFFSACWNTRHGLLLKYKKKTLASNFYVWYHHFPAAWKVYTVVQVCIDMQHVLLKLL